MIKLIDGIHEVELTKDDMDVIFGAVEDYVDNYCTGGAGRGIGETSLHTLDKLRKVYHLPGSNS